MIVTIDDYRDAAGASSNEQPLDEDDGSKFTVAMAGQLKVKLQALNSMLARTPLDQHGVLCFDDVVRGAASRTYVNRSEDIYFMVKHLPWPSQIPKVFAGAYSEVVRTHMFTNKYVCTPSRREGHGAHEPTSTKFAPTFSSIRPLLPEVDVLCDTSLNDFFEKADAKCMSSDLSLRLVAYLPIAKPFPFMHLPAELRLHVYDYLYPNETFVRLQSKVTSNVAQRLPVRLDITRVSKALHDETTKHFFNKSTILIEACEEPRRQRDAIYFTRHTADEYASLVASMSGEVRRTFTGLEVRIVSGMHDVDQDPGHEKVAASPLRQICAACPNLETVVISFQKREEWSKTNDRWLPHRFRGIHFNSVTRTLDWVYAQLPDTGVRIAWDLTHFRGQFESAAQLRQIAMSEWSMAKLIERNGTLDLERSATTTPEDWEKWLKVRELVLEAFARD